MNWLKRKNLKLGKKVMVKVKVSIQSCQQSWRLKTCINTSAIASSHVFAFAVLSYGIHWLSVFQLLENFTHAADSEMKDREGEAYNNLAYFLSYRKELGHPNWKCRTGWWTTKYTVKHRCCSLIHSFSSIISPIFLFLTYLVSGTEMETKVKYKPLTALWIVLCSLKALCLIL